MDTKICSRCGIKYPATPEYFNRDSRKKDGITNPCKKCYSTYRKGIRNTFNGREKSARYARKWRRANPIKNATKQRNWKKRHPEVYKAINLREHQKNRERYKIYHRINQRKRRAGYGEHTEEDINRMYQNQHGKCYYCGKKVGISYHVDHVIPVSRGGSNSPDNLVIACAHCNRTKSFRMPHEWIDGGHLL